MSTVYQPAFKEVTSPSGEVSPSECYFYHTSDLPPYGLFRGHWDLRGCETEYLGEYDFSGKTVFDCGIASGFLAFEMERRGARVIGLDLDENSDATMGLIPYPDYESRFGMTFEAALGFRRESQNRLRNSFWLGHKALGSKVQLMTGNIMTHKVPMEADVALFGSILLHLNDPISALYNIAPYVRDAIIVSEPLEVKPLRIDQPPTMMFRPSVEDKTNFGSWWYLEPSLIKRALSTVGFTNVTAKEIVLKQEPEGNDVVGYSLVARRS